MLKLIGACFIVLATTLAGFQFANRLALRTSQLREFQMALQLMETEIYYGFTPLQSAFHKIGTQCSGEIGQLFERCSANLGKMDGSTTYSCWLDAWNSCSKRLALKKNEQEWLHHFGHMIGNSDREDQRKHLRLLQSQLEKQEKEAQLHQTKNEKMYRTLGVLSGLIIVILML